MATNDSPTIETLLEAATGGQEAIETAVSDPPKRRKRRTKEELKADPNYQPGRKEQEQKEEQELTPEQKAEIYQRIENGLARSWQAMARALAKWADDPKFESDDQEAHEIAGAFTFYLMSVSPAWMADPRFVVVSALANYFVRRLE